MAKRKLVVFTGAGFSKAIASGVPTTKDFYDKHISVDYENGASAMRHMDYLKSLLGEDMDIETIAQEADAIRSSISRLSRSKDYIRVHGSGYDTGDRQSSEIQENLTEALDYLNNLALDKLDCTSLIDMGKGVQKNIKLTRAFLSDLRSKFSFRVFSTNYDNLFRYMQDDPNYYLERKAGALNVVNIDKLGNRGDPCPYIPLKGMLDWVRGAGDLITQGKRHYNSPDDSVIMQFQHIHDPEDHPYREFYKEFEEDLAASDIWLFIGFSFRDRYINRLIRKHRHPHGTVVVITKLDDKGEINSFNERVNKLLSGSSAGDPQPTVHSMHEGFDIKSQASARELLYTAF